MSEICSACNSAGGYIDRSGGDDHIRTCPLITAVCRLLGGCEPGAVILRLEAALAEITRLRAHVHAVDTARAAADIAGQCLIRERDALRAKLQERAAVEARLVAAAWEVVCAAETDVPSDEELAAMAAGAVGDNAHPDGCWTATESFRDCRGDGHFMCRSCSRREEVDHA